MHNDAWVDEQKGECFAQKEVDGGVWAEIIPREYLAKHLLLLISKNLYNLKR